MPTKRWLFGGSYTSHSGRHGRRQHEPQPNPHEPDAIESRVHGHKTEDYLFGDSIDEGAIVPCVVRALLMLRGQTQILVSWLVLSLVTKDTFPDEIEVSGATAALAETHERPADPMVEFKPINKPMPS